MAASNAFPKKSNNRFLRVIALNSPRAHNGQEYKMNHSISIWNSCSMSWSWWFLTLWLHL